jgi:hypothetical protein
MLDLVQTQYPNKRETPSNLAFFKQIQKAVNIKSIWELRGTGAMALESGGQKSRDKKKKIKMDRIHHLANVRTQQLRKMKGK